MIFYRIFSKLYETAARKMCSECADYIKPGSKILDLGCGSGIVGKTFGEVFKSEVTGVDIIDQRIVSLDFQLYNGENLPFSDDTFDAVLINYVLHHCQDPIHTLREAKRVTKDKMVIYEDLPENIISKLSCKIHGISFAYLFQKNKIKGNFKSAGEWEKIFEDLGLRLIYKKKVWTVLEKKLFVLEKEKIVR